MGPPRPPTAVTLARELVADGWVTREAVAAAFATVPRALFVPEAPAAEAYANEPIVVKRDPYERPASSSSQPSVMARMLELLDVQPGDRVLEVGAGTGYNAALLRELVGPRGQVTTVDVDPALARRARAALRRSGHRARVLAADGRNGYAAGAPYDRIIVTASHDAVAAPWIEQMRPGGRLVVPLRLPSEAVWQVIPAFERHRTGAHSVAVTWGGFMNLHDGIPGPPESAPQLTASYHSGRGHELIACLTGPGTERLSATARRRLLATVIAEPSPRRHRPRTVLRRFPDPPAPLLALLARLPAARRVELRRDGRVAVGLLAAGGAALASFREAEYRPGQPLPSRGEAHRERWWIEAFGAEPPVHELERALEGAGRGSLRIEVGNEGAIQLRWV